ncbi:AI-2E family transporter [Gulosibacter sp. 10]|uniref:AI-2E family transporter n=1 Tax=Gulosibacter sp. 10 TaxID=1255570 RepID=UPI00097F4671|nr:AI-2E family transporter [Gulosibacter sp. 10]SJM64206.1 putative integral membrane protein [Gulosibacter sp. 10]
MAKRRQNTSTGRGDAVPGPDDFEQARQEGRLGGARTVAAPWTDGIGLVAVRALQFLLILTAGGVLVFGALQVSIIVIPLLLALIIASAMEPVLSWLSSKGWPRLLSTVLVLLVVVLLLGGAVWLVVAQIMAEWDGMAEKVTEGITQLIAWWNSTFPQFELNDQALTDLWGTAQEWLQNLNYGAVGSGVASGIGAFGSFAMSAVLFVVILFFFLKDGPTIWSFLIKPLKEAHHRRAELMGLRAVSVMGGYVRGTVIVALVDAVFIGIGLVVLQVPLAFPLALVVFITAFIPVVGATLAGVIAALVTLVTNGLWPAVIVVIIVVVVNQLEGNLLQPIVLGRSLKLHELVVLLALTTGTVLGGIVGTLIAVPLTAVGWALIKAWNEPLPDLERDPDGDNIRERLRENWRRKAN